MSSCYVYLSDWSMKNYENQVFSDFSPTHHHSMRLRSQQNIFLIIFEGPNGKVKLNIPKQKKPDGIRNQKQESFAAEPLMTWRAFPC